MANSANQINRTSLAHLKASSMDATRNGHLAGAADAHGASPDNAIGNAIARVFRSPLEKKHEKTMKQIDHAIIEGDRAISGVVYLSGMATASLLENEAQMEQTVIEYSESELAKDYASRAVGLGRGNAEKNVTRILDAVSGRITRNIER